MGIVAIRRFAIAALAVVTAGTPACRSRTPASPAESTHAAGEAPAPGSDEAALARARAVLGPFKVVLRQVLTGALTRGAPTAIDACAVAAGPIATQASTGGARVGRASTRLRNPANAAPAWVAPILDEMTKRNGGEPRLVWIAGGGRGYVEPIVVQPMCLVCHGKAIAPDVAAKLDERYPDDRARGYAAGELRGVYWVELPPEAASSGG